MSRFDLEHGVHSPLCAMSTRHKSGHEKDRFPARHPPASCNQRAPDRMFAISFAINLRPVAVILRPCRFASCNQRAHDPPMFAITTPDVGEGADGGDPGFLGFSEALLRVPLNSVQKGLSRPLDFCQVESNPLNRPDDAIERRWAALVGIGVNRLTVAVP